MAKAAPVLFAAFCGVVLVWGAWRLPQYPIEQHFDVSIYTQVSSHEWMIGGPDLSYTRFNCCPDSIRLCSAIIQAGYIARTVRYEERGTCRSIYAAGLGFFYHKPNENWWTKLDHAREY